jgi:hypothetical protein
MYFAQIMAQNIRIFCFAENKIFDIIVGSKFAKRSLKRPKPPYSFSGDWGAKVPKFFFTDLTIKKTIPYWFGFHSLSV